MSEQTDETTDVLTADPDETPGALAAELDESGLDAPVLASVGSVALALYYYYVSGDKQRGQFVGLWPATILGLAIYLKLDGIERLLRQRND